VRGEASERAAASPRAARGERSHAIGPTPAALFLLAILLMYVVSGGMLWLVGYNYEGLTGSPLTKIHPGTYIIVVVFGLACLEAGHPIAGAVSLARDRPASVLLLAAAAVLFIDIVVRKGPGMAGVIDSFMLPPLAIMLYAKCDPATRGRIEDIIHLSMLANALLALLEFATKHQYFPFRLDGETYPYETRASSLQGHPLGNATITAFYVLALVAGGGRLAPSRRAGMVVLQLMAMVAFGGRAALVTTLMFGGIAILFAMARVVMSGRVPLLGAAAAILAATLLPVIVGGLFAGGFFDAFLMRFSQDGGSANARVEMFDIVKAIPLSDLMFGPDIEWVDTMRRTYGLEQGIENPIIRSALYQGMFVTALMIVAIGLFIHELTRWSRRGMALPIMGFIIIVNSFESLAGKSTLLTKFALMMLVLFQPVATEVSRRVRVVTRAPTRTPGGRGTRAATPAFDRSRSPP
jgi:hypothetical protein